MALLLSSVFGVTGCGSDENTQLKTEITQLETEISQFEARVDALEEQAGSRVTNLTLDQTDDAVQFQSRSKNAEPEASGVSDAPSEADCDRRGEFLTLLDRLDRSDLHRLDVIESGRVPSWGLREIREMGKSFYDVRIDGLDLLDELDLDNLDHLYDKLFDELDFLDGLYLRDDLRGVFDQCGA